MVKRTPTLYESATARSRVLRQGDIACVIVDGGGAMVMSLMDFLQAQKWATSKPATGNLLSDRTRFLDQMPALISRPGSLIATRGNLKQLEQIARSMRSAGYEMGEWNLPVELKPKLPTRPPMKARPVRGEEPSLPAPVARQEPSEEDMKSIKVKPQ